MSQVKAYLQITLDISDENRPAAAKVYNDYRRPFLDTIEGAGCEQELTYSHRRCASFTWF